MGDLYFSPEDFDSVITLEDLTNILADIVSEIRAGDKTTQPLLEEIEKLITLQNNLYNYKEEDKDYGKQGVKMLFAVYEQTIKTSMQIRKLLAQRGIKLQEYNDISYSFYYKGARYASDTINLNWLRVSSDGALKLNIDKAVKDLKQQINSISQKQLQEIFRKHFEVYLAAIFGMYKGSSNRLNQGRVAEAFEAHLTEHHPNAFQYLNTLNVSSVISQSLLVQFATEAGDSYWAHHEDPNSAWIHVRGAMGTQRGTVAGDVRNRQVKSAKDSSGQVKLSTLTNLKTGIKRYADILNPEIPCRDVALKLARYLTEPVKRNEKNLQAYIANKELSTDISKLQGIRLVNI